MKTVLFVLPGQLREFAGGRQELQIRGTAGSVAEALSLLWAACPGTRDRVLTERGDLRPHINVFLDGEHIRHLGGLAAPVRDGAELTILPALSGG